jgi:hypothetical protein
MNAESFSFEGVRLGGDIGAGAVDELKDIPGGRGLSVPALDRAGEFSSGDIVVIDVITGAVAGAGISHAEGFFEGNGNPHEIGTFGDGPGPGQRIGEEMFGDEFGVGDWFEGVSGGGFLDDVIDAIDFVMPGTAVPVIIAGEVENTWAVDVQGDVERFRLLIKKVAGIGGFIATGTVVGAAHIGAGTDTLVWPAVPLFIGIECDGDLRGFSGGCVGVEQKESGGQEEGRSTERAEQMAEGAH